MGGGGVTCVPRPVALDASLTGPQRQRKTPTTAGAAYSALWCGLGLQEQTTPLASVGRGGREGGVRVSWRVPPSSAHPPDPATPTQSRPTHAGGQATQTPTGPPHCHAADTIGVTAGLGAGTARSRRAGSEMRCAKRAPQSGSRQQRVWRSPHPSRLMSRRPPLGPSSRRRPPPAASGSSHSPGPFSPAPPFPPSRVRDECACHAAAGKAWGLPAGVLSASRRSFWPNSTARGHGCWRRQRNTASSLARGGADPHPEHSWQKGGRGDGCRRWPARPPAPGCGRGWSSLAETDRRTTGAPRSARRRLCARCNCSGPRRLQCGRRTPNGGRRIAVEGGGGENGQDDGRRAEAMSS